MKLDYTDYENTHGRVPRERGRYIFALTDHHGMQHDHWRSPYGMTYAHAARAAQQHFINIGWDDSYTIKVLP